MARNLLPYLVVPMLAGLASCSVYEKPQRPAWRGAAENACFAQKQVQLTAYVQQAAEISGPGICGMTRPLKVTALQGGAVRFNATTTLDCSMVAELDAWLADTVQPAAMARFGQAVTQINSMGGYSCRGMNNQVGARLSEHAFGNAIDVGGFILADGRVIVIRRDWTQGDEQKQAFLREVQGGACERFTTVLAPGSNAFHYDHLHVDLAMHGNSSRGLRRICKPAIKSIAPAPKRDDLPDAPEMEEETDIAQAKTYPGQNAYAMRSAPSAAIPPVVQYQGNGAASASHLSTASLPARRANALNLDLADIPTPPTRNVASAPARQSQETPDAYKTPDSDDDVTSSTKRRKNR